MTKFQPLCGVLRISDVRTTKNALEAVLQTKLDRFEPSGSLNYAQLDIPIEGGWSTVVDWIVIFGPRISALRHESLIGSASIDLAIPFNADLASTTIEMPSHVAETVGRYGIDIEFSVYLSNENGRHCPTSSRRL